MTRWDGLVWQADMWAKAAAWHDTNACPGM